MSLLNFRLSRQVRAHFTDLEAAQFQEMARREGGRFGVFAAGPMSGVFLFFAISTYSDRGYDLPFGFLFTGHTGYALLIVTFIWYVICLRRSFARVKTFLCSTEWARSRELKPRDL
jgi:hypothetical protein